MNPKSTMRIFLIGLLFITGLVGLLGALRCIGSMLSTLRTLDLYSLLFIAAVLGGLALFVFASISVRALLQKRTLHKHTYIIAIIFSFMALIILIWFGYGLVKDLLDIRCTGFFGVRSSCMLSPLLLLSVFIFHPISLAILGAIASYGIYRQSRLKK